MGQYPSSRRSTQNGPHSVEGILHELSESSRIPLRSFSGVPNGRTEPTSTCLSQPVYFFGGSAETTFPAWFVISRLGSPPPFGSSSETVSLPFSPVRKTPDPRSGR